MGRRGKKHCWGGAGFVGKKKSKRYRRKCKKYIQKVLFRVARARPGADDEDIHRDFCVCAAWCESYASEGDEAVEGGDGMKDLQRFRSASLSSWAFASSRCRDAFSAEICASLAAMERMLACFLARYLAEAILLRWRRSSSDTDEWHLSWVLLVVDATDMTGEGGGELGAMTSDLGGEGSCCGLGLRMMASMDMHWRDMAEKVKKTDEKRKKKFARLL